MEALTTVHTPRLLLRRLQEQDLGWMQRMDTNVNIVGPAGVRSADECERLFGHQLRHWDQHGFGLWLAFERTTLTCAGRGGLCHVDVEGQQVVQLGYVLFPKFWGQGLATEIAEASTQTAFETLTLKRLVALSLPMNLASRRVLQKVKFHYLRDVQYDGTRHVLYERLQT